MRFSIIYGAAAIAAVAAASEPAHTVDNMCVMQVENSGMLYEKPCGEISPLHKKHEQTGSKVLGEASLENRGVHHTLAETLEEPSATAADKRATYTSESNTWLHTMLLSDMPVSVWVPYPVFTTEGVVWSATSTKFDGTTATYLGGPIATAYAKRNSDGVGQDAPTFFQDISTVVTVHIAAETVEMVVETGHSDLTETFTISPSTATLTISADLPSTAAKEKRQAVSDTTTVTTSFVYSPANANSTSTTTPATSLDTLTTAYVTGPASTVTQSENTTSSVTSTHTRQIVYTTVTSVMTITSEGSSSVSQNSTAFVTAEGTTAASIATTANVTGPVAITSTVTPPQYTSNGTTFATSYSYNISDFTATGLTLTHASTLLSTSTASGPTTTTDAVMSGSIGGGMPAASTTKAISGADRVKYAPGKATIISSILVGLTIVWFAEKYLGRLHV